MSEKEVPLPDVTIKEDEAHAWVVRLSSDQRTRADEQRFREWLDEDDANGARFEAGQTMWDQLGALRRNPDAHAALGHLYEAGPLQDNHPQAWTASRRALLGGGVAALAATLAGVVAFPKLLSGAITYETARGEQRRLTLADGSSVVLDTATRIKVTMEAEQRLIKLEQGQAFFDVARDPSRPFRVFAGKDEIRALGTAFQVRFESGSSRVILEEGKVAVFRGGALKSMQERTVKDRLGAHQADVVLSPGQAIELQPVQLAEAAVRAGGDPGGSPAIGEAGSAQPFKPIAVDLSKTDAWRDGEMVFDDVSLAAAVAEVNRYGGAKVVLGDHSLAKLHISGTFHTNRPEDFVEGVTAALPVRLKESTSSKLVLGSA